MSTATLSMEEQAASFEHLHLDQVDPSFTCIPPDFYNLRVISAEMKSYDKTATGGKAGKFINIGFAVVNSTEYAGRRVYESLFPNNFTFRALRRLQDATGIQQNGDTEAWLKELATTNPIVKLKVDEVPDVNRDGVPNPRTVKADGTPDTKNVIAWKAGVQPGDVS